MGLFGKFLGATKNDAKVAKYEYKKAKLESEERKKEAASNKKENQIKSIQQSAELSLNYAKNNYESMCERIGSLFREASDLINLINNLESRKLSKDEKKKLAEAQEDVFERLEYLYLAKDYFAFLTRLGNGMELKNEQMLLIVKFGAFFDGVDVLSTEDDEDNEDDDSLLGSFKEIGKDFKEMFVSSKKSLSDFSLSEYVDNRYCEEINDLKLPKIGAALDAFEKIANKQKTNENATKEDNQEAVKTVECPNCHSSLPETAKFCPNCGTKIESRGPAFCMECGSPLNPESKFCPQCGAKINKQ